MEMMQATEVLSTHEVARLVGCSYRQLDYWCRKGFIPGQPTVGGGSGSRRCWHPDDVQRARMLHLASRLSNQPIMTTVELLERELALRELEQEVRAIGVQA